MTRVTPSSSSHSPGCYKCPKIAYFRNFKTFRNVLDSSHLLDALISQILLTQFILINEQTPVLVLRWETVGCITSVHRPSSEQASQAICCRWWKLISTRPIVTLEHSPLEFLNLDIDTVTVMSMRKQVLIYCLGLKLGCLFALVLKRIYADQIL